jgi:queuosine precursor transporter
MCHHIEMLLKDKVYHFLCVLFAVLLVSGNLVYQKFVSLPILPFYTFELSVGAIFYPLTFLITDLIAEFYSKSHANFCVRQAIVMNIVVTCTILVMDSLQATHWSKVNNETFHTVFGFYGIGFIGSIIACYVAQRVDIILYLGIRKLTKGKMLWLRNNGSTAISLLIDTTVVISFLTIFGALPADKMLLLIFNSYIFKLFFTVCSTPLFYAGAFIVGSLLRTPLNKTALNAIESKA